MDYASLTRVENKFGWKESVLIMCGTPATLLAYAIKSELPSVTIVF